MKEYIERNDLIRELEDDLANDINMYNSHIDKEIRDDKICFACDVLASAPVADVRENIQAKWAKQKSEVDGHPIYWYKCSNCGCNPPINKWGHEMFSKFCPDCGAEMRR